MSVKFISSLVILALCNFFSAHALDATTTGVSIVANPDTATATTGVATPIDVLFNDTGTSLVITAITQPTNGTAAIVAQAKGVTYTSTAGFTGTDSFTYTITSTASNTGTAQTSTGTVTVTVKAVPPPAPPVANPDTAKVNKNSTANVINVLANDLGTGLNITAVTQGINGGVVAIILTPATPNTVGGGPMVTYTPAANYVGADHFTYTITDVVGTTATGTVDLAVVDTTPPPPVANPDSAKVNKNSSANPINVLANDVGTGLKITAITQGANGGVVAIVSSTTAGSVGQFVTYTPAQNYVGADHFTYTITDANNATATATVTLTVVDTTPPQGPVANPDTARAIKNSTANPINVLANDVGTGLKITAVTQGTNGGVVAIATSTGTNAAAQFVTYTPAANYVGADHFTYTITDANSATATGTVDLSVFDPAPPPPSPVANPDSTKVAKNSSATAINVLANDVGTGLNIASVTQGINGGVVAIILTPAGTTIVGGGPMVTFTPAKDYVGADHFTYTIKDSNGATATGNVDVLVVDTTPPSAPIANPDTVKVTKNSSATAINVLSNDVGSGLNIASVTQGINGGVVSIILTPTASNTLGGGPMVTYKPAKDYVGADHFTYTIRDSNGLTATGNVDVLVVDTTPPPVPIANPDSAKVGKNSPATPINVLANDVGTGLKISAVTQGTQGGVVAIVSAIAGANPTAGSVVTYAPAKDYVGPDHFTYTITDSNGATAIGNVDVLVVDTTPPPGPIANPDSAKVNKNSTSNIISVLVNDVGTGLAISAVTQGANGTVSVSTGGTSVAYTPAQDYTGPDHFTYTITDSNKATAVGQVLIYVNDVKPGPIANPDFATVVKNSPGVDIDVLANDTGDGLSLTAFTQGRNGTVTAATTGTGVTYVPAKDYVGMDYFTYTVTDSKGLTATGYVSVLVVNSKPSNVAAHASPSTVAPGGSVAFYAVIVTTTNTTVPSTLTFSWNFGDGSSSTDQNPTHTYAAAGTYTATVSVSSGKTVLGTASVTITVQGGTGAPTALFTLSSGVAVAGSPITLDGSLSLDPGNAIVSYAWDFGDQSPLGDTATVTHTYAAAGPYSVTLTVTDNQGLTGSVTHTIQVLPTGAVTTKNHVHYVAKYTLGSTGGDTLTLDAVVNVGTTAVAAGTTVSCSVAGVTFNGTLDSKLQDTSLANARWQVKTGLPGPAGNVALHFQVRKASLAAAFTAAGGIPGANSTANVTASIPVTIAIGAQDMPLKINTVFTYAKGGKATAAGDGP